jgi:hypothetical protein
MVPEQHVRYETRRHCYNVPEVKVCYTPYTTCKMVPEQCVRTVKCYRTHYVPEERVCQVPYTTCRLVPEERVRCVPRTECKMEPYCMTYQTCRYVPVCQAVTEPACPPLPECCTWRKHFFSLFSKSLSGCCY